MTYLVKDYHGEVTPDAKNIRSKSLKKSFVHCLVAHGMRMVFDFVLCLILSWLNSI